MNIFNITGFLLIVGSLSLTSARNPKVPTEEELARQIPGSQNVPGFDNLDLEKIKTQMIKQTEDKCKEDGEPNAFETLKKIPEYFRDCMSSTLNVMILGQEIEAAIPQGKLDTVFKKYCQKVPTIMKCVQNVSDTTGACLNPEEKDFIRINRNITNWLLEYLCQNDGDRITKFITDGGLECFKEKQQELEVCTNETIGKYYSTITRNSIPSVVIDLERCNALKNYKDCVVPVWKKCPDSTPVDFVDSLYIHVTKVTPCESLLKEQSFKNAKSDTEKSNAEEPTSEISKSDTGNGAAASQRDSQYVTSNIYDSDILRSRVGAYF